jgi:VanZ family protein
MHSNVLNILVRAAAWAAVCALAVLSLIPVAVLIRTEAGGPIEHVIAYCGTAILLMLSYSNRFSPFVIVLGLIAYAGLLEVLQNWSPGRTPAFFDFLVSSIGAVIGVIAVSVWQKYLRR